MAGLALPRHTRPTKKRRTVVLDGTGERLRIRAANMRLLERLDAGVTKSTGSAAGSTHAEVQPPPNPAPPQKRAFEPSFSLVLGAARDRGHSSRDISQAAEGQRHALPSRGASNRAQGQARRWDTVGHAAGGVGAGGLRSGRPEDELFLTKITNLYRELGQVAAAASSARSEAKQPRQAQGFAPVKTAPAPAHHGLPAASATTTAKIKT
eukprot:SAG11_NODE_639_length_8017_cov_4.086259_7_plen_209_part_00